MGISADIDLLYLQCLFSRYLAAARFLDVRSCREHISLSERRVHQRQATRCNGPAVPGEPPPQDAGPCMLDIMVPVLLLVITANV